MQRKVVTCAFALGAMTFSTSAFGFVSWTNSSGMADDFTWENGGSDNGLYGDPTLVGGNTLVFFPSNFRADSADGVSGAVSDRLQVDILAKVGKHITEIQISEFGDYGIVGTGTVSMTGSLIVTDLNNFRVENTTLATTPLMPISSGSGNWEANGGIDFTTIGGELWTHIRLVLDNNLSATTEGASTSFIEKKVSGTGIQITLIPTPGSMALFAVGALAMGRRRR